MAIWTDILLDDSLTISRAFDDGETTSLPDDETRIGWGDETMYDHDTADTAD